MATWKKVVLGLLTVAIVTIGGCIALLDHFFSDMCATTVANKNAPKDIWLIREDGTNLELALRELHDRLLGDGLKWFLRFEQREEVLRIFTTEPESMGELWGFGNNPSPHRSYCIGYSALALGQRELALRHLKSALSSGCFQLVENQLHAAIDAAAQPIIPQDAAR